jgi:asparagine synthase (glutamine-hydrolysing)
MSGIAGIVRFDGAPLEPGPIERMTAAMAHRGPDGIRHWSTGSVALGQCMLCTTPESLDERGPLANEDGSLVLVMDGRVDNWEELRRELLGRGAVLRDRTDAELVLRAYEVWGRECLSRIDGDFAFAVWDARRREAFCARDRFGQKPFHYHWDGTTLAFASDVHAVLALPWVPQVLNEGMVAEFLANEWLSLDETFWEGVLRLQQARRMTVDARGPRLDTYWAPDLQATLPCRTEGEFAEHYRSLLTDSVRRMSRTSGPLACELSGGLDSSALVAVTERLRREGKLLAPSLDAYTLAFTDDSAANEMDYARAVGKHLGIRVREVAPTHKPLSWYRERAMRARTFPSYPNGVMGLGIREQAAARGSRALIVGIGGDEWLTGSRSYYSDAVAARDWSMLANCLLADRKHFGSTRALWWLLRIGFVPFLPGRIMQPLRGLRARRTERRAEAQSWLTDVGEPIHGPCPRLGRRHGRGGRYRASPPVLPQNSRRVRIRGARVAADARSDRQIPAPSSDGGVSAGIRPDAGNQGRIRDNVPLAPPRAGGGTVGRRFASICGLGRNRSDCDDARGDRRTEPGRLAGMESLVADWLPCTWPAALTSDTTDAAS